MSNLIFWWLITHGTLLLSCFLRHDGIQDFLAGLNVKPEEGKPLTHWHPKFKIDSLPAIPCAELPALPTSKACSSASEVLQLNTIKSEKVGCLCWLVLVLVPVLFAFSCVHVMHSPCTLLIRTSQSVCVVLFRRACLDPEPHL